ncbi:MAG TPA: GNAT family N-acetyltransferase, partial [Mycobacteriales bacterium]|nr:GNAT family N-acetyltransferase [Mycobacteriales bacterium]
RDLGNGLRLRWSTASDTERIVECAGRVFGTDDRPDRGLQDLVRRFMRGDYPFMGPEDFALVEDTARPDVPVVACACYLREEWDFAGIPIPVARPEIVASDRDYRRKGLVRAVFSLLHERSTTDGTLLQGITGIRYFYRQFGYEYALDLGGGVTLPLALVPDLPEGEKEPYRLRPATEADLGRIAELYRYRHRSELMSLRVPDDFWHYLVATENDELTGSLRLRVLENSTGEFTGFVSLPYERGNDSVHVHLAAFVAGVDLAAIVPSLARAIRTAATDVPARKPEIPLRKVQFQLGRDHPLCTVIPREWAPQADDPYAWYLRIPDVPAFLRHIGPELEKRLAASAFAGHTGEIPIDLYRYCVRLAFAGGRLESVERYEIPLHDNPAKAGFPPLAFIPLVVGYRSLADLRATHPDAWAGNEVAAILEVLFPKVSSHVFGA